jgi:hypothetical protein
METIVLILGALAVLLIAAIALVWVVLKRHASKSFASIPPHITLHPTAHPEWKNAGKEKELTAGLRALQFYELGAFTIPELKMLSKGFLRPEDRVIGALFEHSETGIWADLFVEYEDGKSLTVSNSPRGGELDKMPGHEKIIDSGLTLVQMLQLLDDRRGAETARFVSPMDFPEMVRNAYAREYEWRKERGGASAQEVLRVAGKSEQAPVLACVKGPCPYEYGRDSDREIEGMPFPSKGGDPRACPTHGHLCPEFMEELGLTVEDLRIRATIHCASVADQMVREGKLGKDSREYRELTSRSQEIMARYPAAQYPQYYR